MFEITIFKKQKEYYGFKSEGHSGYAAAGEDIVCAGLSALVINTINSIEALTEEAFSLEKDEEKALLALRFDDIPGKEAALLMDSLVLGIEGIQKQYQQFVKLTFKEV